jgi:hypothetical protein
MIQENQIVIDWDFNTYELAIIIKPKTYLMTDICSKDGTITDQELIARGEFEIMRKKILKFLNSKEYDKA